MRFHSIRPGRTTVQVMVQIFIWQYPVPILCVSQVAAIIFEPHLAKSSSCISLESILAWQSVWLSCPRSRHSDSWTISIYQGFHLKEIRFGGITYFTRMAGGEGLEEMEGFPQRDSFQYMLGDLLKLPGDTFTSIYDLVDDWKHIVKLTDILPNRDDYTDGDYAWVLI